MAEVAGPGQFSKRTDKAVAQANRSLPDAGYGEQAQYQGQESAAKMAQSQDVTGMNFNDLFGDASSRVIPMNAPTAQPDVPVTAGAASGAGPGVDALKLPDQQTEDMQKLQSWMPVLEFMANQPGASWAMRNVIRKVKGMQ
jgi:hypothetical protein